jgi:hypothetical protein
MRKEEKEKEKKLLYFCSASTLFYSFIVGQKEKQRR